jgi:hypothetical protein
MTIKRFDMLQAFKVTQLKKKIPSVEYGYRYRRGARGGGAFKGLDLGVLL